MGCLAINHKYYDFALKIHGLIRNCKNAEWYIRDISALIAEQGLITQALELAAEFIKEEVAQNEAFRKIIVAAAKAQNFTAAFNLIIDKKTALTLTQYRNSAALEVAIELAKNSNFEKMFCLLENYINWKGYPEGLDSLQNILKNNCPDIVTLAFIKRLDKAIIDIHVKADMISSLSNYLLNKQLVTQS